MKKIVFILLLMTLGSLYAQWTDKFDPIKDIDIKVQGRQISKTNILLIFKFEIKGKAHIQKNDLFQIESQNSNYIVEKFEFPVESQSKEVEGYQGEFDLKVQLKNKKSLGKIIPLKIRYQCCVDDACLLPVTRDVNFKVGKKTNYLLSILGFVVLLILYSFFKNKKK